MGHLRITIAVPEIVLIFTKRRRGLTWRRLRSSLGCQGREAVDGARELLAPVEGHGAPVVSPRTIFAEENY